MNKTHGTNVHVIDGVTYVEVDRKAEVGDKVIIIQNTSSHPFKDGEITDVKTTAYKLGGVFADNNDGSGGWGVKHEDYIVLEPLESEECCVDTTQAHPSVIDLLANLSQRVTSLEQQLRDNQRNIERQAEELENAKHRIRKHEDRFVAVEERVGMLTDDVVTLDERTQVINEITKFYDGGER